MKLIKALAALHAVACLAVAVCSPAAAATVEELLAGINKLPPKERQRRLEEGARKEGRVVVYSNQGLETIQEYSNAFSKKYPFIKVEASRLQGAKGLDRILLEHRVGKLPADVVGVDFDNIGELLKADVHARYDSPEKKHYASQFWDKQGRWYVNDYTLVVIAYNTSLVKPSEAPRGYPDLLDPKWKNDISIDNEPEQAVFAWLMDWGEAKTAEYMKALMRNGAVPRRGHTLQVQLLCSGETKIAVEVYPPRVMQMKYEKKCPIAMVWPNPTPGSLGSHTGIMKSAKNPHAAALYMDFLLSEDGVVALVRGGGTIPARTGAKAGWQEILNALADKRIRKVVIGHEKMAELKEKGYKLIEDIIVRKQLR
ncbi:MAG TPA: extracellular solute-binding protein [candidate division Zixibacteria bacterium]|nr:extracellular solute-binding protein [candidate division Zixibacteria bacterium]